MYDPNRPVTIAKHSTAIEAAALVAQHYFPEWEVAELGWKGFGLTKGDHEIFINKVGRWTAWYSIDGYEDARDFDSFEVLIDWLRDEIYINLPRWCDEFTATNRA